MKNKAIIVIASILSVIVAGGIVWGLFFNKQQAKSTAPIVNQSTAKSVDSVPTIFLHGYSGSDNSEKHMVSAIEKAGKGKYALTARINEQGKVRYEGKWDDSEKNPLIMVALDDNKNANYPVVSGWISNLFKDLKEKYHINKYNVVAHSMGNILFMEYILNEGYKPEFPVLKKQVAIAAPLNGIVDMDEKPNEIQVDANGKPNKTNQIYNGLVELKDNYPKDGVEVLNIMGDINDGSHSDERVTLSSAKSLKYLVGNNAKSYQEAVIVGENGQHSKLHETSEVDTKLIDFLYK